MARTEDPSVVRAQRARRTQLYLLVVLVVVIAVGFMFLSTGSNPSAGAAIEPVELEVFAEVLGR